MKTNSNRIKILVCCHKPCELPKDDIFLPIQVGSAISNVDLGIQRDDQVNGHTCENISAKNMNYCELTAMYWAWKNIKKIYSDLEYIGLNHYRRFFSFDESSLICDYISKREDCISEYKINHDKLNKILSHGNVIVPKKWYLPFSLDIDYKVNHISDDFRILQEIVHRLYPEYDDAFYKALIRSNALTPYNMNIMSWTCYNEYCSWLFDILFECERQINISHYNPVQRRIFGYMSERLFNVYMCKNFSKIRELNVFKYENNKDNFFNLIKRRFRGLLIGKLFCYARKNKDEIYANNQLYINSIIKK